MDTTVVLRRPPKAPRKPENSFFLDVEGLRGVAVALVVLFHAGVPHMAGGFVGVDVFFVISGFLITGLLLREFERNGRVSFKAFYARRARRIIPPAAVVIVATSIAVWFLMPLLSVFRQALDLLAAAANIANWRFIAAGKDYLARRFGRQRRHPFLVAFHRGTVLLRLARVARRVRRAGPADGVVHPHGRGVGNRRGHGCVAGRVAAGGRAATPCCPIWPPTPAPGNSASARSSRWLGRCSPV